MATKPILFSGPMVRALLDGRKTQTRRVPKLRGHKSFTEFGPSDTSGYDWHFRDAAMRWHDLRHADLLARLPYATGDLLWVREAHYLTDDGESEYAVYAEDEGAVSEHLENMQTTMSSHPQIDWSKHLRLRPSVHMPRWASRLTLRVTDVRVQRVQDISETDAIAEGLEIVGLTPRTQYRDYSRTVLGTGVPQLSFKTLWDSLNAKRGFGWDANPWVAAYTFEAIHQNVDEVAA